MDAFAFIGLRKRYYGATFGSGPGKEVLADLARFCHMRDAPWHPDTRGRDVLIGRQEVFHRIMQHLHMSESELYELYNRGANSARSNSN